MSYFPFVFGKKAHTYHSQAKRSKQITKTISPGCNIFRHIAIECFWCAWRRIILVRNISRENVSKDIITSTWNGSILCDLTHSSCWIFLEINFQDTNPMLEIHTQFCFNDNTMQWYMLVVIRCFFAYCLHGIFSDGTASMLGHVGDGNFHTVFVFDPNDVKEKSKIIKVADQIAKWVIKGEWLL